MIGYAGANILTKRARKVLLGGVLFPRVSNIIAYGGRALALRRMEGNATGYGILRFWHRHMSKVEVYQV